MTEFKISEEQLHLIVPHARELPEWTVALNAALRQFGLDTPARAAMFLAQIAHESGELRHVEENLNYSADALRRVWPSRFQTAELAQQYARKPEHIANKVYANRMGNGDEASGDGWKYRGRGLLQITGKNNYKACGDALGLNLVDYPEKLLMLKTYCAQSAAWFFVEAAPYCVIAADKHDLAACTRRINGGLNGLADRKKYYDRACVVLKV